MNECFFFGREINPFLTELYTIKNRSKKIFSKIQNKNCIIFERIKP
jgi:hypothetical protein